MIATNAVDNWTFNFQKLQSLAAGTANRCCRQLPNFLAIPIITTTGNYCICHVPPLPPHSCPQTHPRSMWCQPLGTAWQKRFRESNRSGNGSGAPSTRKVFGELKACYQTSGCLHAYQRRARRANLINMLVICAKLHFPFSRVRVNGSWPGSKAIQILVRRTLRKHCVFDISGIKHWWVIARQHTVRTK